MAQRNFRIGLVLNPMAGIGGPVALKGSDGADTVSEAIKRGAHSVVADRVVAALDLVASQASAVTVLTVAGAMGEDACNRVGLACEVVCSAADPEATRAEDTRTAVKVLQDHGVDLVLFAGGDGTARDVCDVAAPDQVVLGIPCGVKMHSGVFANTPLAAGKILIEMINGRLVSVMRGEVRDIDEAAFREGTVRAKFYGEMWVPAELHYIQAVKSGGKEVEALVIQEIAADVVEHMAPGVNYFIGSGSTTTAINDALGLPYTLLGVDVIKDGELVLEDARESALYKLASQEPCHIVVTIIGGQGHIFGRGNQQFSARVLRAVGSDNITVIATKSKLKALEGRPLLVDTGDAALDAGLDGMIRVVTGYEDAVLYRVDGGTVNEPAG